MKKVISFILVISILLGLFSGLSFNSAALDSSGSCGEYVTYIFNSSTGLLTISGSGEMKDYYDGEVSPFSNQYGIKTVVIENGVTSIGSYAFENCRDLKSITIPGSVTSIDYQAFYNCRSLTSITILDSVTSIGFGAFYGTGYYNDSANWDNNVLYIGNHLIEAKDSISGAYTIKSGTKTVAGYAFDDCSRLTSVTIPNSVISICSGAFSNCSSLTSITIPASVKNIGESAFENCSGITSFTIPDSVTSIGSYAFYNTGYYNNSANWSNNVLYIGNHLIKSKETLSGAYTIKSGTKTVADWALSESGNLTSFTIPDSVTSIGIFAFVNLYEVTSITIPGSVTSIGEGAFSFCGGLKSITVAESNTFYDSRNHCNAIIESKTNTLISGCENTVIPGSVTSIGAEAFSGCYGLTSITIPGSVTRIGWDAFYYCWYLTSITIPASVTSIGEAAFFDCYKLKNIYYTGSHARWNTINIGKDNEELKNATIHYNYNPDISHAYKTIVTKPKSNAVGYTRYKCTCGEFKRTTKGSVYIDKYTAPTGKPSALKCASRKTTSEKFTWKKVSGVSGYQIQISTKDGKKWGKTYNAKKANSYTIKGLTSGSAYKVRVRFYITKNGKNYYGKWATLTSPTIPSATSFSKITSARKTFTAQWKKIKNVTGYEIQYAKKSNFSDAKTLKYKSAVKFTIKNKKGGKKYFIRVRTYKTIGGKNYYSAWSKTKTVTTKK